MSEPPSAVRRIRKRKIRPRYLQPISTDLTVLNLIVPATDEDFESAVEYHLPVLAELPWKLSPLQQAVLSKLLQGYQSIGAKPGSVKLDLLTMALLRVLDLKDEEQAVRIGRSWLTDENGRQLIFRPSLFLGDTGKSHESNGDEYWIPSWLTAECVDAFTRWLEQVLLREVRRLLEERVDILDDAWRWTQENGIDDGMMSSTGAVATMVEGVAPVVDITGLRAEYEAAMGEIGRHVNPEDLTELLDIMRAIHSGERAWSGENSPREARVGMRLRYILCDHPESAPCVHQAWRAADALGAVDEPLPALRRNVIP